MKENNIEKSFIKIEDFPVIVLSDNMRSFFSFMIKKHTKGYYSHIMIMYEKDKLASQNMFFRSVAIEEYLKPYIRLKFFGFKNLSPSQREIMIEAIKRDLKDKWYKRTYDFLGIFGHLIHIPKLNNPFKTYCTERVNKYLRLIGYNPPKHPTPAQMNRWLVENDDFSKLGYWFELK